MSYPTLKLRDGFPDQNPQLKSDVQRMQIMLKKLGYRVDTDGFFGQGTEDAIVAFQRAAGLEFDGIVGRGTWEALEQAAGPVSAPTPPPSGGGGVLNGFHGDSNWVHTWEGHNGKAYWPGGSSGVTLDPGIDLGHANPSLIEQLYGNILSSSQMAAAKRVMGIKGEAAKSALSRDDELQTIRMSRAQADSIFDNAARPYWDAITRRFPELKDSSTPGSVQTAFLSLSYNRGAGNSALEVLRSPLERRDWRRLANEIGSMQQDHPLEGVRRRRQAEGDLIRSEVG